MLKLLFVHCGPLYKDVNGNYYEYSYHGLYERYSYMADKLTFLMEVRLLEKDTENTLLDERIRVVSVPNLTKLSTFLWAYREATRIIAREIKKADIAVLRQCPYANIAITYCKKYGKPYIYENVGCPWDSLWNYGWKGKIIAPIEFIKEKKVNFQADYVYYVTNKFLQKRYPTKGKSVGCSNVVIEAMDDLGVRKRAERIKTMLSGRKIIIGTAAALDVPYKGQEYVIKALKDLITKGYNLEYWLAGSNRKKSTYLKDMAKKFNVGGCVRFCGSLNSEEMIQFYDSLDIYIQPSKQEGLPRSVIEALSRGCLTIASNIAGNPELLDREFLFKKGNIKDIVEKVEYLLNSDLSRISNISNRNRKKANEYRIDVLEQRRKGFYDDFMKKYEIMKG